MSTALPEGSWDTHCHIFPKGYPSAPDCPSAPAGATLEQYNALKTRLGIEKTVLVQSNAFGTDNTALVATLAEMAGSAVGVAAVSPGTPKEELQRLHDAGVRGARIMDLGGGRVPLSQLEAVIDMVRPFGWVPIVQFDGNALSTHEHRLSAIEIPWVLDHYGKVLGGASIEHIEIMKKLQDKNCTIKLAAHYEASSEGPPDYADMGSIAKSVIAHNPERVIWGSNWPHLLNGPDDKPDDQQLLDQVFTWIPDAARMMIFTKNPARMFGK